MVSASKSGPFSGGKFLNLLINQFLLKTQLRDSDFLEAKEDLGRLAAVQLLASNVTQQKKDWGTTHFECIQN